MIAIKQLKILFDKRDKLNLFCILLLILVGGFLEMLGIGLILPFLAIISKPDIIEKNKNYKFVYELFPELSYNDFIVLIGTTLIAVNLIKNIYIITSNYIQQDFLKKKKTEFATKLFKGYMERPYEFHLKKIAQTC